MKKFELVILDANVVINAHLLSYWKPLISGYRVFLPATVLRDEVRYFDGHQGKEPIKLMEALEKGLIYELEASLEDEVYLQYSCKTDFFPQYRSWRARGFGFIEKP